MYVFALETGLESVKGRKWKNNETMPISIFEMNFFMFVQNKLSMLFEKTRYYL